jgi:hypothetical protein
MEQPSDDDRRNESATYAALFSSECQPFIADLYQEAMGMMRGRSLADCDEALNCLAFLQDVVATAMWRHRCPVEATLASFAREFDRLDVATERARLFSRAQTP